MADTKTDDKRATKGQPQASDPKAYQVQLGLLATGVEKAEQNWEIIDADRVTYQDGWAVFHILVNGKPHEVARYSRNHIVKIVSPDED
jgi:hypothetical protein